MTTPPDEIAAALEYCRTVIQMYGFEADEGKPHPMSDAAPVKALRLINSALLALKSMTARVDNGYEEGHNEPCGMCGEKCVGEPWQSFGRAKWPVALCGLKEPGVTVYYHESCLLQKLRKA